MDKLSPKEKLILQDLAFGNSTKEIADKHEISRWTVINHIRSIYDKLRVSRSFNAITAYYFCYTYDLKDENGNPLLDHITKNSLPLDDGF